MAPRSETMACDSVASADTRTRGPIAPYGTLVAAAAEATPGRFSSTSRIRAVGTPAGLSTRALNSGRVG